jgi:endonuclease-3 related protein
VERALAALRSADCLNPAGIARLPLPRLEQLVRSSGYYRQKARRLKMFVAYVDQRYGGSLETMFSVPTLQLRSELLALNGIGPETADTILLYAGRHEIFVVDGYARRVLERHAVIASTAKYEDIRALVEASLADEERVGPLPRSLQAEAPPAHQPSPISSAPRTQLAQVYNEMHGYFVQLGKHYCYRVDPDCPRCPLREFLPENSLQRELPE